MPNLPHSITTAIKNQLLAKSTQYFCSLPEHCSSIICCLNRHNISLSNSRSHTTDTNTKLAHCAEKN